LVDGKHDNASGRGIVNEDGCLTEKWVREGWPLMIGRPIII
jgi:hypothetical protein